jgi:hypothetical protein
MKFRCCVFDCFQLSYFADVELLLPVPIWVPTPHHCRIGWYDFKPSLSGWNSWLLAGLVDERWRHWTGYFVIILLCKCCLLQSLWWKCCEIITGRSVSWYDSETHLRLVSPDLDYQTLVCIIDLTLVTDGGLWNQYKTVTTKRKPLSLYIIHKHDGYTVVFSWMS